MKATNGSAWNLVLWTNDTSFVTAKQYWAVPPTPQIVAPGNGSIVSEPVAVTATFPAIGCTITKVEFYEENRLLASITSAPYSFTWNGVHPVRTSFAPWRPSATEESRSLNRSAITVR